MAIPLVLKQLIERVTVLEEKVREIDPGENPGGKTMAQQLAELQAITQDILIKKKPGRPKKDNNA